MLEVSIITAVEMVSVTTGPASVQMDGQERIARGRPVPWENGRTLIVQVTELVTTTQVFAIVTSISRAMAVSSNSV